MNKKLAVSLFAATCLAAPAAFAQYYGFNSADNAAYWLGNQPAAAVYNSQLKDHALQEKQEESKQANKENRLKKIVSKVQQLNEASSISFKLQKRISWGYGSSSFSEEASGKVLVWKADANNLFVLVNKKAYEEITRCNMGVHIKAVSIEVAGFKSTKLPKAIYETQDGNLLFMLEK